MMWEPATQAPALVRIRSKRMAAAAMITRIAPSTKRVLTEAAEAALQTHAMTV